MKLNQKQTLIQGHLNLYLNLSIYLYLNLSIYLNLNIYLNSNLIKLGSGNREQFVFCHIS